LKVKSRVFFIIRDLNVSDRPTNMVDRKRPQICIVHLYLDALGGLVVMCQPLHPMFAGSNLPEDNKFLRARTFRSMTSFGGESRWFHVVRFYGMLNNTTGMTEILRRQNSRPFLRQASPASLLNVSTGNFQRRHKIITNQMGTHNISQMVKIKV
jgi:hypothetical protein